MLPATLLFGGLLFWIGLLRGQRLLWLGGGGLLGLGFVGRVGLGNVDPAVLPVLAGIIALVWALETDRFRTLTGRVRGVVRLRADRPALGISSISRISPRSAPGNRFRRFAVPTRKNDFALDRAATGADPPCASPRAVGHRATRQDLCGTAIRYAAGIDPPRAAAGSDSSGLDHRATPGLGLCARL